MTILLWLVFILGFFIAEPLDSGSDYDSNDVEKVEPSESGAGPPIITDEEIPSEKEIFYSETADETSTETEESSAETDVDECLTGQHYCNPVEEECKNTVGSFKCVCKSGYIKVMGNCFDIDECFVGTHNCPEDQQCFNLQGAFLCCNVDEECVPSSTPTLELTTARVTRGEDVDECAEGRDNCNRAEEECQNTPGSFRCVCRQGFKKVMGSCFDVDECHVGIHNCSSDENCINIRGSFMCECKPGRTCTKRQDVFEDLVTGGWSEWTKSVSECLSSCFQEIYLLRSCTSPSPSRGGPSCTGDEQIISYQSCVGEACVAGRPQWRKKGFWSGWNIYFVFPCMTTCIKVTIFGRKCVSGFDCTGVYRTRRGESCIGDYCDQSQIVTVFEDQPSVNTPEVKFIPPQVTYPPSRAKYGGASDEVVAAVAVLAVLVICLYTGFLFYYRKMRLMVKKQEEVTVSRTAEASSHENKGLERNPT